MFEYVIIILAQIVPGPKGYCVIPMCRVHLLTWFMVCPDILMNTPTEFIYHQMIPSR